MTEQLTLDDMLQGAGKVDKWEQVMERNSSVVLSHYTGTSNGIRYNVQRGGWLEKGKIYAYFGSTFLGWQADRKVTEFFKEINEKYHQRKNDEKRRSFEEGVKRVRGEIVEGTM